MRRKILRPVSPTMTTEYNGWVIEYSEKNNMWYASKVFNGDEKTITTNGANGLQGIKQRTEEYEKQQKRKKQEQLQAFEKSWDREYKHAIITTVNTIDYSWGSKNPHIYVRATVEGESNSGKNLQDFVKDTPENREKIEQIKNLMKQVLELEANLEKFTPKEIEPYADEIHGKPKEEN